MRACFGVLIAALLVASGGGVDAAAREGTGAGIFFDLPGCLLASPCSGSASVFPMARLVLGSGFSVAHLDMLFLTPTTAAAFLPYWVLNFPIEVSPAVWITPYAGVAPVLTTVSAAPGPAIDWLFKFGNAFTFSGFGFFAELSFSVPLAPAPTLALGFLLELGGLGWSQEATEGSSY